MNASPMRPEDRARLDGAYRVLDSLWQTNVADLDRIDEPGPCDDCDHPATVRFRLGQFTLCRTCTTKRRRAGQGRWS